MAKVVDEAEVCWI